MAFTNKQHVGRQAQVRRHLAKLDIDYGLFASGTRLRYLTGYTGSNGLLVVGPRGSQFMTDGRYREQARKQVRGARVMIMPGILFGHLSKVSALGKGHPRIGYEPQFFSDQALDMVRRALPNALLIPETDLVDSQMQIKEPGEIACIQKAAEIADAAFTHVLEFIKPGVQERDVAAELEYSMTRNGSERRAFETIVASGPRAALPHGVASDRRIRKGDFITMDYGAVVDGYASDITRTVVVGKASPRQRKVYELVQRAQRSAVARIRAGANCAALDRVARQIIARAGFGKRFDHGLGHGLGLAVHEGPGLNARSTMKLKSGMVITIEPGVYFPGWGGVRIEDDVVVRPGGHKVLTSSDRSLIEL